MHALHQHGEEVRQHAEGRHVEEGDQHPDGEVAVAQQPERHQRVGAARLDEREQRQQQDGEDGRTDHQPVAPAEFGALDEGEHQQGGTAGDTERARQVEPAALGAGGVARDDVQRAQRDQDAERHVDVEDGGPAEVVGQHAAQERAEGQTAGAGAAPDREGPVPLGALREQGVDQGEGGRQQQRAADALDGPGRDDVPGAGRETAGQRGQRVQGEGEDEHPAPAQQVGRAPAEQQEAAGEDDVGADHQLLGLAGEAQVLADLREGHEHDVQVEAVEQLGQGEQGEGPPQVARGASGGPAGRR
ncbi:hypothetical protein SFUMM280S_07222 [Streptomyces fumanus]